MDTPSPFEAARARRSALAVVAPGSAHTARGLGFGLDGVAVLAQRLLIGLIVRTTFGEWYAVVANGGERHAPCCLAHLAQWFAAEQIGAPRLQATAGDPLGFLRRWRPCSLGMLGAAACAVTY